MSAPSRSQQNSGPSSRQPSYSVPDRTPPVSSASSSMTSTSQSSRADQVVYQYYLKTVAVLVDARLTHYAGPKAEERKKGKWFNLELPEVDLHRSDLQIYRSVSGYPPAPQPGTDSCIPPLLVAFILDTSDIPNGHALIWNRAEGKLTIDPGLLGKGKGKEKEQRSGLVLERWTFSASNSPDQPSSSQQALSAAYRLGIIHFRALFSLIRLLPAYRLFRRVRRANNGLRLGIKLWGPDGYTSRDLNEAWTVMERGLIGLDMPLNELVKSQVPAEEIQRHTFPPLELFGTSFTLSGDYRPEVDFHVEDMESVLSEKLVDMDEDWFTPTVARHRMEDEKRVADTRGTVSSSIPSTQSPIPQRQQGAGSSSSRPSGSRAVSGYQANSLKRSEAGSLGTGRWGALGVGLPFAGASPASQSTKEPPSPVPGNAPSGSATVARRLSGHSMHPFTPSPSTSYLRSNQPTGQSASGPSRPGLSGSRHSSVGRTSSFLSQSGRSFTHAQLANMQPASASPPVTGAMHQYATSPSGQSPSLSFSKQPVPRSLSGRPYMTPSQSSPFIASSLERDSATASTTNAIPQIIKRYSSSLSNRLSSGPVPVTPGSQGSSNSGNSLPASVNVGPSIMRTSTRALQESSLRHSLEKGANPDDDDIQAFLRTLDALPQPPSVAAQGVQASRSHLPSTSSSLSSTNIAASATVPASTGSPGASAPPARQPMTRAQVDDTLKRMADSFNSTAITQPSPTKPPPTPGQSSPSKTSAGKPSVGLLTASRPGTATGPSDSRPMARRQTSGSSPLAKVPTLDSPAPIQPALLQPQIQTAAPLPKPIAARSLPGSGSAALAEDSPLPLRSAGIPESITSAGVLSPQTTGGTSTSRRGPVLLRGGFGEQARGKGSASASASPSHSPIRDFARLNSGGRAVTSPPSVTPGEDSLGLMRRYRPLSSAGVPRGQGQQRTAPSSLGGDLAMELDLDLVEEDERGSERGRRREGRVVSEGGKGKEGEARRGSEGIMGRDW